MGGSLASELRRMGGSLRQKSKTANEVDAERDRATPRRRQDTLIHSCMSYEVCAERDRATPASVRGACGWSGFNFGSKVC